MAENLFDQAKFILGLGTFAYALWSIWGSRYGIGKPPWPGDYLPEGLQPNLGFLKGTPEGGAVPAEGEMPPPPDADMAPAESESFLAGGWYYGRPIRDAGLPWEPTEFGENDPKNRLTVA